MGEKKFPSIMKVVKTALILGYGNAEVERGFSEKGKSVTDDRVRLRKRQSMASLQQLMG